MDCKEFREALDLYVDEELSPDALAAAHLHLSECAACRDAERNVLSLRRALKVVVSKHQPPAELVRAVSEVSQPWWRKLLRLRNSPRETRAVRPLWRKQIALPAPIFMLLIMSLVGFGLWSTYLRTRQKPLPAGVRRATTAPERETSPAPEAMLDFARFDQGGRASLYKERR